MSMENNVRDTAILWAKRLSWEIQGQAKSATASASCVRGDRGRNGFRQINDELVIPLCPENRRIPHIILHTHEAREPACFSCVLAPFGLLG